MTKKPKTVSKFGPPKYGLAIDWETSGADYDGENTKRYQGISFGAIIFDTETFEEVDHLYCEIKFDGTRYRWTQDAERVHGLSREHLEENGLSREDALYKLLELLVKWMGPNPGEIMFLGHNIHFDIAFTRQLFEDFDLEFRPYFINIDTAALGYVTTSLYKSDDVFDLFVGATREGGHDSLEDARLSLATVRNIRSIFNAALEGV